MSRLGCMSWCLKSRALLALSAALLSGVRALPEAAAKAPPGRYVVTQYGTPTVDDDTVLDTRTGLVWQRATATPRTQEAALAYCGSIALGGGAQIARLPTRRELQSLVDYTSTSPAIDSDAFPGTAEGDYWTSTLSSANAAEAWDVGFMFGITHTSPRTDSYYVRCVR